MIIAVTGVLEDSHGNRRIAGAGKDEVAKVFVKHGFVSVAFADIMKRWCKELFGFTDEQLWGPSEERAKPDERYPRGFKSPQTYGAHPITGKTGTLLVPTRRGVVVKEDGVLFKEGLASERVHFLTVRYALQKLGDWGRDCYPDIWADKALETIKKLVDDAHIDLRYNAQRGLYWLPEHREWEEANRREAGAPKGAVIPDMRFQNEFVRAEEEGAILIRVKKTCDEFPSVLDDSHVSERDILAWGDEKFHHLLDNSGSLQFLQLQAEQLLARLSGRIIPYDEEKKDIPPFKR